uniref:NR LBD domain-containing protein n=1 Tax=Steinernema glaseri TaxID=37863 RepID=A0A1I8AG68_9BILA
MTICVQNERKATQKLLTGCPATLLSSVTVGAVISPMPITFIESKPLCHFMAINNYRAKSWSNPEDDVKSSCLAALIVTADGLGTYTVSELAKQSTGYRIVAMLMGWR